MSVAGQEHAEIVVAGHVCLDVIPLFDGPAPIEPGRLIRVGDGFAVSRDAFDRARAVLHDGITLAEMRDALGVGRKTAQLYLERFDADGVTRRVGDARVLRRR